MTPDKAGKAVRVLPAKQHPDGFFAFFKVYQKGRNPLRRYFAGNAGEGFFPVYNKG